jgi:hypothetical protein
LVLDEFQVHGKGHEQLDLVISSAHATAYTKVLLYTDDEQQQQQADQDATNKLGERHSPLEQQQQQVEQVEQVEQHEQVDNNLILEDDDDENWLLPAAPAQPPKESITIAPYLPIPVPSTSVVAEPEDLQTSSPVVLVPCTPDPSNSTSHNADSTSSAATNTTPHRAGFRWMMGRFSLNASRKPPMELIERIRIKKEQRKQPAEILEAPATRSVVEQRALAKTEAELAARVPAWAAHSPPRLSMTFEDEAMQQQQKYEQHQQRQLQLQRQCESRSEPRQPRLS